MVLKWLRRMWPSAMAAPVGMSARRGIASVSMKPRFGIVREKASFLTTNSRREPRSVGALFVCVFVLHGLPPYLQKRKIFFQKWRLNSIFLSVLYGRGRETY